jgi:hypothetical protein
MSDAGEKLDRSRQAILEHVARRQRKHDPREEPPPRGYEAGYAPDFDYDDLGDAPARGDWFGHVLHGVRTWWRYHPAHMAVELASPLLRDYARRKPLQLLGISLAAGAALTFARPWRLISITTLLVALLKSSQLSQVFMAAMSAADYRKDHNRPE